MSESDFHSSDPTVSHNARADMKRDDEIDLAQLWSVLWGGKWRIVACVVVALILAVAYLFVTPPTYRANALIQVDTNSSASPLEGITSQLGQLTGDGGPGIADAQVQILSSRSVVGDAVRKLHLTISAKPAYFPVIGRAIARRRSAAPAQTQPVSADDGWWLSHYAWAPASIKVTRFDIPDSLHGKQFILRALGGGHYVLFGPQGRQVLKGQVGREASGKTALGRPVALFVQQLEASAPPTDFIVSRHAWLAVTNGLSGALNIAERGKQSGIVSMSLEGHDRAHITHIVNAVANNYLQQNVQVQSEQAKQSLEFLKKQLPKLRSDVQTAETKLANYQQKSGQTVDLTQEGQALLNREVMLKKQQAETKMQLAQMSQLFTNNHPKMKALQEQLQQIKSRQAKLQSQFESLPEAEKTLLKLQRDVQVKTQLYTALLNRAQQLRVMKAGTVGTVHIIDHAVEPVHAVAPKKKLILVLAIFIGAFAGAGWLFLRLALQRVVHDPNDIERQLGLPIYAVIPFSNWLSAHTQRRKKNHAREPVLARERADDVSVEALRSLRTSLYFAQLESGSNAIAITGPTANTGKSFVSANLAYLLAETDQRVVLVDADMRKGRLHHFLEQGRRDPGLSQVLTGQVELEDALRPLNGSNVQILTSGQVPPNPSELLMRESFTTLLDRLKREFDLVIIDTPPILAVTDASVIAGVAPGIITFLVIRAGEHPIAEIDESAKRLVRQNSKIAGVIFNGYKRANAYAGGRYAYYYQYAYKAENNS